MSTFKIIYLGVLEGQAIRRRLCCHPELAVPDGDTMLAQKLTIEAAEPTFLALANVHPANR